MTDQSFAIEVKNLHKSYKTQGEQRVLRGVDLQVPHGARVAILGASGSGKSTLLQLLGLLDHADSGEIYLDGELTTMWTEAHRSRMRLEKIGFVFQFHHLIAELTALENIVLPASLLGLTKDANKRALELMEILGIPEKAPRFPWQLSGGEQARVAIARALMNRPKLLLTDEATGNLDEERATELTNYLFKVQEEMGTTLIGVTHDVELASRYSTKLRLKEGQVWVV